MINWGASMELKKIEQKMAKIWSPFIGLPLGLALLSFILFKLFHLNFNSSSLHHQKLFSVEELSLYNGTDPNLPIFLGVLGSVFDVTKGRSHYGEGGGYNHFAGRDASRAFVSGNFTGVVKHRGNEMLVGAPKFPCVIIELTFPQRQEEADILNAYLYLCASNVFHNYILRVKSVVDWRDFYSRMYIFVGNLVGRYYNSEGKPTKYLKGVEAKAARGSQLMEKQKTEEAKVPSCNSRWSQNEGSEVWCDDGFPRLVQRPLEIALTGKMSKRCACFKEDELEKPGLEIYEGCDFLAKRCKL